MARRTNDQEKELLSFHRRFTLRLQIEYYPNRPLSCACRYGERAALKFRFDSERVLVRRSSFLWNEVRSLVQSLYIRG